MILREVATGVYASEQCSGISSASLMCNSDSGIEHLLFCLTVCGHLGGVEKSSWT